MDNGNVQVLALYKVLVVGHLFSPEGSTPPSIKQTISSNVYYVRLKK